MLVFVFVIFFVAVVLDFQASFLVVERTNSLCSRRFTVRFYCSLRPFQVRRSSIAILPDLENLEQFIITKKRQPTNNGRVFWLYKLLDRLGLTWFGVSNMNWTIYREKRVEFSLKFSHSLDNLSSLLCRRRGRCFSSTYILMNTHNFHRFEQLAHSFHGNVIDKRCLFFYCFYAYFRANLVFSVSKWSVRYVCFMCMLVSTSSDSSHDLSGDEFCIVWKNIELQHFSYTWKKKTQQSQPEVWATHTHTHQPNYT